MLKPNVITVIGRRWFQKTYGNTYHTVDINVDGIPRYKSKLTYGYGSHYETTAFDWLKTLTDVGTANSLRQFCKDNDIRLISIAVDVPRQRDL